MKQSNTFKRLGTGVVLTAFLVCCFFGATFTLHPNYAWAEAPANSLNGGIPVIDIKTINQEYFEPGATIKREFTIENLSGTDEVRYFFYFDIENMDNPITAAFADSLNVHIKDTAGNTIANGSMVDLQVPAEIGNRESYPVLKESKDLILLIQYSEDSGNAGQLQELKFDMHLAFLKPETTVTTQ